MIDLLTKLNVAETKINIFLNVQVMYQTEMKGREN